MAGINIPGVTDQYKTSDTVEKLMKVERIPLTREQDTLDEYKAQKEAWRDVNKLLTSLRDSVKTLYSYENPFNNKLTTSTDEFAITAEANRSAEIQDFKIDVIQPATPDKFLSEELENDYKVPQGTYTFKVGEKQLTFNYKGGSLKDFSDAVNKRGKNILKTMIVGTSFGKKTLMLEALSTGKENKIIFEGDAKSFAEEIGMIEEAREESVTFGNSLGDISIAPEGKSNEQERMPALSLSNVKFDESNYKIEPRGAFKIDLPESVKGNPNIQISFTISSEETTDITIALNEREATPQIPNAGVASFGGIDISNISSDPQVQIPDTPPVPLNKISTDDVVYAVMADGSEKLIRTNDLSQSEKTINLSLKDYEGISSIVVRNRNTGKEISVSNFEAYDTTQAAGYKPKNAVSVADDAIIKYEGITIRRTSNDIDDVIPEITLHVHEKTEKTTTLSVKPDAEASKDALIEFVGRYNQAVAEINILMQSKKNGVNNDDIIDELTYLTSDEKEKRLDQLGLFSNDFSLSSIKSNMANIVSTGYKYSESAEITMLSQLGIATNASGYSGSYSQSKLRGYLEIDEKKLDNALENHLDDIKALFGYDSDGDLIIDEGIAYKLDKQITAYTQTGGILALKTSTLDSKIKSSETKITTLERQLKEKESQLKKQYSQMEGSLNSLESQQNQISNFTNQQNRNNNR